MGVLTDEMKKVVEEQRLGFVATVCADGTPNLSTTLGTEGRYNVVGPERVSRVL